MDNYEVGQRVRFMHEGEYNAIGVIRGIDWSSVAIEIEQTEMPGWCGHDCNGLIKDEKGWWVSVAEINDIVYEEDDASGIEISSESLNEVLAL